MSAFEVNLCLNSHSYSNTPEAIKRRLACTLACLRKHGHTEFVVVESSITGVNMRLLRARVQADHWDTEAIYKLSKRIQQDCISVYSPSRNEGDIIGRRADKWGEFALSRFSRFDWAAEVAKKRQ